MLREFAKIGFEGFGRFDGALQITPAGGSPPAQDSAVKYLQHA